MKSTLLTLLVFGLIQTVSAQETKEIKHETAFYSGFLNIVPDNFSYPLFGFINIAKGNHQQLQFGFVNTTGGSAKGVNFGFVNTAVEEQRGVQFGFVNTAGSYKNGLQFGYVNVTKKLDGLQFGFVNYADTVKSGLPIGFISVVKNGGYRAFELSASETSPIQLAFKIGVKQFYTSLILGYHPDAEYKALSGAGFGFIKTLSDSWVINPEIISLNAIGTHYQHFESLHLLFGYKLGERTHAYFGPTVTLHYNDSTTDKTEPVFTLFNHSLADKWTVYGGVRFSLRWQYKS
ncbi:hypothetical protein EP331_01395 [bacterium]|nr:MAG: hypothetical protein EP331_01395 [bacterium]